MASLVYCPACARHTPHTHPTTPYHGNGYRLPPTGVLVDVTAFVCRTCGRAQEFRGWREWRECLKDFRRGS